MDRMEAERRFGPLELEGGYWYPAEYLEWVRALDAGTDPLTMELEKMFEEAMQS